MKDLLSRLMLGLDAAGVPSSRGRVKSVAAGTGYSEGMVSRVLAGKVEAGERFIRSVHHAFNVNPLWVTEGQEPVLTEEPAREQENALNGLSESEPISALANSPAWIAAGDYERSMATWAARIVLDLPTPAAKAEAVALLKKFAQDLEGMSK